MRLGFVRRKEGGMLSLCHSRGSLCLEHRAWFAEKIMTMLFPRPARTLGQFGKMGSCAAEAF